MDVKSTWIPTWYEMDHGSEISQMLIYAKTLPLYPCKLLWVETELQQLLIMFIRPHRNHNINTSNVFMIVMVSIPNDIEC